MSNVTHVEFSRDSEMKSLLKRLLLARCDAKVRALSHIMTVELKDIDEITGALEE